MTNQDQPRNEWELHRRSIHAFDRSKQWWIDEVELFAESRIELRNTYKTAKSRDFAAEVIREVYRGWQKGLSPAETKKKSFNKFSKDLPLIEELYERFEQYRRHEEADQAALEAMHAQYKQGEQ